jgi:tripartite-type tricarboxylate transporter receptor subunit TctC
MKRLAKLLGIAFVIVNFAYPANAESSYPNRQIQVIVPYTPGGALDTLARIVGKEMSEELHQPLVVLNKPGGATITGSEYVAHSPPDGYTLLFGAAPLALNVALGMTVPFDVFKDFAPISLVATSPILIAVNLHSPYKTLADVLAAAKTEPKGISYASPGVGSAPHLIGEALRQETKANLVHVPFRGSAPALTSVLGDDKQIIVDAFIPTGQAVVQGQLRAIIVASKHPVPALPGVPTTVDAGYPDLTGQTYFGLLAPAGTSPDIIQRLHQAVVKACANPAVRKNLESLGYDVVASTPEEYSQYLHKEIERWTPVVKAAGIKID